MRLGGRLAAAIEVLDDIERRHRPAADALKDWGLSHRFAGGGDRAAIGNIVYDALRRKCSAAWLLGEETPRALAFGALLLEWGQTPEALNRAVLEDRFAPPPLTEGELHSLAASRLADAPPSVQADCPDWCAPLLEDAYGDAWIGEGAALCARPPLDLRVNRLKAGREEVLSQLRETAAAPTPLAPHGLRIAPIEGAGRHPNVQATAAFRHGLFEVQDEGSQIVSELAGAVPGMQVLDYCAGAGGKALALSAAMDNRGQIFAHDADRRRLAPLFERMQRNDSRNIQVAAKPAELSPLAGRMDIVLVDAPCTGSGTWRRRPDAKWRLTRRQLDMRMQEQATILDAAQRFVKPGGLLVYITCSVFREENGAQVEAFHDRGKGFRPLDHRMLWDERFPGHEDVARIDRQLGISLSPARGGTDGFYFSALRKDG